MRKENTFINEKDQKYEKIENLWVVWKQLPERRLN